MIVGDGISFAMNPKCASSSIAGALALSGCKLLGLRHEMVASDAPIRGVVHRDNLDRLESGWRNWCKDGLTFDEWLHNDIPEFVADGVDFKTTPQEYWTDNATHVLGFANIEKEWRDFAMIAGLYEHLPHLNRSRQHA